MCPARSRAVVRSPRGPRCRPRRWSAGVLRRACRGGRRGACRDSRDNAPAAHAVRPPRRASVVGASAGRGAFGCGREGAGLEPFPVTTLLLSGGQGHEGVSFAQSAWIRSPLRSCRRFGRPAALLPQQGVRQHDELAHHGDNRDLVGLAGGLEAFEHDLEIPVEACRRVAAMNRRSRGLRRPPRMCRAPRCWPLSSANGATPISAAAWRWSRLPSSGIQHRSAAAVTGPTPGIEVRMRYLSACSGSLAITASIAVIQRGNLIVEIG